MKKFLSVFIAIALVFSVTAAPTVIDAAKRGGFSSGVKKYNTTPNKSSNSTNSTNQSNSNMNSSTKTPNNTATTQNRGFFSGGSLMKGLMIGGLAGMLFGGMFANMGFLGNVLGLLINVAAIFVIIMLVSAIVRKIRNRQKPANTTGRWNG